MWQKNKEKSRDWHHGTGRTQVCLSLLRSEPRIHSNDQSPLSAFSGTSTNRICRSPRHQLLASHGLQSLKDSFKNKARVATTPPLPDRKLTFVSVVRKNTLWQTAHLREKLREGRGSLPSRWQKAYLFSKISKWTIFQLYPSLVKPNATMFLKDFICLFVCLFLEREDWMEKERKRNIDVREKHQLVAFLNLQPRHVPRPGIKQVTFCFARQRPTS